MQKLWIILISISLLNNLCNAQENTTYNHNLYSWDFYTYLFQAGLYEEALSWLSEYPEDFKNDTVKDRLNLEIAKIYLIQKNVPQANIFIKNVNNIADTADVNLAITIAVLSSDTLLLSSYIHHYRKFLETENFQAIRLTLKIFNGGKINEDDLPSEIIYPELRGIAMNYKIYKKKSPLMAGLLSALVPGLGKFYLGNKYQAISAFTMNVGLGAIFVEYLYKSTSVLKWVLPLPVTFIFYSGNILGSVLSAHKRDIDFINNTHENIHTYFYTRFLHNL